MIRKSRIGVFTLAAAVVVTGVIAVAGDLNPAPGPVAPTMKKMSEVEPRTAVNATNTPGDADSLFKITQPGSYYFTGNITGVVGKHGIEIATSGVTLDLNGFVLQGIPAMGAFDGVSVTAASQVAIAVVNGTVRNWGDDGIDLSTNSANCRVADVLSSDNTGVGIWAGNGSVVSNCSVYSNSNTGMVIGQGSTVSNCLAYSNTGHGISTLNGCTVSNCSAAFNSSNGFALSSGSTVLNCSAYTNSGNGISAGTGSSVSNSSGHSNSDSGIFVSNGSIVAGCSARANTIDGIACTSGCEIRGNTCSSNGNNGDGAGIHATGSDNRIEGNNCTLADRGIDVDAAGNVIIRNTCAGNTTDWDIVANNIFGPIVDRRAPASAAVSGFSATSSLGTTDANANFSY